MKAWASINSQRQGQTKKDRGRDWRKEYHSVRACVWWHKWTRGGQKSIHGFSRAARVVCYANFHKQIYPSFRRMSHVMLRRGLLVLYGILSLISQIKESHYTIYSSNNITVLRRLRTSIHAYITVTADCKRKNPCGVCTTKNSRNRRQLQTSRYDILRASKYSV